MEEHGLVTTAEEVEALAARLKRERVIGLDTEADSFFHYFDKICLLQIATRTRAWLIDPLELPEKGLEPLGPVLADPGIRKVLHAAEYDLYVLQRYGGLEVRNLFDTMISAQLLGYSAVGLGALVERHFDVKLSKDQQRTDWSRRPLRDAQVQYAIADVLYLIELAERLEKELKQKKRLEWAQKEFRALEERVWPEREFDPDGHLRIKGAKKLPPKNLAVLRELYLMRDRRARELDRPPFKVLGNGTLIDLALHPPGSRRSLSGRKGITDLVVRRFGQDILQAVRNGLEAPAPSPPERKSQGGGRRRLDRHGERRLERLKSWRSHKARELELDPGVFCPNAALEEIAWANPRSAAELKKLDTVKRWWADEFAEDVAATLAEGEREGAPRPEAADGAARPRRRRRRRGRGRSRRSGSAAGSGSSERS